MPKGSSSNSGPSKDPMALRRDRDKNLVELPAEGRDGATPEWPLPRPRKREIAWWEWLWSTPQAVAWDAHQLHVMVALYVRNLYVVEQPGVAPANRMTEVRRTMDDLGLTEAGLRSNGWTIVGGGQSSSRPARSRSTSSARERLKVVDSGEAG